MAVDFDRLKIQRVLLISGLFDAEFYLETYADIRDAGVDPLAHYVMQGEAEGRSPNPVFFPPYYRRHAMAGGLFEQNALAHYIEEGERLGWKPNPAFDPRAYLAANPKLAEFVDRPLFHFLRIGRPAGLPLAPGETGAPLRRVLQAQPRATNFELSGRRNHYELMRYKQVLVSELGIEGGFALYREAFGLPDSDRVERKPVVSLYEFAREHAAAFHEIAPAGEPFGMPPPRVIGDGNHRALEGVSRAIFVACLIDARVRARSGVIEVEDVALLDYQADELARIDDELDFDPAVFHAERDAAWIIVPDEAANPVELDEAFMLLGPHSDGFGHWMLDLLPRYIAASASGALPPVPLLIDASMAETQRQCLELMLPNGVEIIALPSFAVAQIRRLWCASSPAHVPVLEKENERLKWDYCRSPLLRFGALVREMGRRLEPITATPTDHDRIYLARRRHLRHALVNAGEIETAATERGFAIIYPEDLSFPEQARLLRHARHVVGPEGAQLLLAFFSQPGTKLCHLCHPYTTGLALQTGLLDEIGVDTTVLTGPFIHVNENNAEQYDFRIDPRIFCEFLDGWLNAEPEIRRPSAGNANSLCFPNREPEMPRSGIARPRRTRIGACLGVKDEAELIEPAIAHLRAVGVDFILACDAYSTDGTLEILERHRAEGEFSIIHLEGRESDEIQTWERSLSDVVKKAKVDWIVFLDADEFLIPASGNLKNCVTRGAADVLSVDRFNIPLGPGGPMMPNSLTPDRYRELLLLVEPIPDFRSHLEGRPDIPWIRAVPSPRFMARPGRISGLSEGWHEIIPKGDAPTQRSEPADLVIAHLPFTTRARFLRKIDNIRKVFASDDEHFHADYAWHWRRWISLADQGRLDEEFDRTVFTAEAIAQFRCTGVIRSAAEIFTDRMAAAALPRL